MDFSSCGIFCHNASDNGQNVQDPDHLELTILKITGKLFLKSFLLFFKITSKKIRPFSEITSTRWQEWNNRQLFSVKGVGRWSGP